MTGAPRLPAPMPARPTRAAFGLPPGLQPWAAALGALRPDIAAAIGPLVQRLDELLARHGGIDADHGHPDGVGDIAARGPWERLVIAEWALAAEVPDEFLRRAATGELLRTAITHRHDRHPATVRVLVDSGPGQAGAARLVHLAAVVVLHRRAQLAGAGFALDVLRALDPLHADSDLPTLLRRWWRTRTTADAAPDDVLAALDADTAAAPTGRSRTWVVGGPALQAASSPEVAVLTCEEALWDTTGVREVRVRLQGERVDLPVPPSPVAIAALRGEGFRSAPRLEPEPAITAFAHPWFPAAAPRLFARGSRDSEIAVLHRPENSPWGALRPWNLREPVIGWGVHGKRELALVRLGAGTVQLRSRGKSLRMAGRMIDAAALGLDDEQLDLLQHGAPARLGLLDGQLLVHRPGHDSRLVDDAGDVTCHDALAVMPQADGNQGCAFAGRLPAAWLRRVRDGAECVRPDWTDPRPARDAVAYRHATTSRWSLVWIHRQRSFASTLRWEEIDVPVGEHVIGPVWRDRDRPELACRTAAGLMLRLRRAGGGVTTPGAAAGLDQVSVHPSLPWAAGITETGALAVVDLTHGTRHLFDGPRSGT